MDVHSVLEFQLSMGRKLLSSTPEPSSSGSTSYIREATPDPDRLVILTVLVLLCLFICGLGLYSLLRCLVQWRMRIVVDSSDEVGNDTGLKKAAMKALPIMVYRARSKTCPVPVDCPICLAEFAEGDKMRVLPNCNHGFHMECIDKWFVSHSSCPMCRNCLNLNTRNKKPEGAAVRQAIESNDEVIHIVLLSSTDSSHVVGVVSPQIETIKRTAEGVTVTTPPQLPNPLSLSENES